MIYTGNRGEYRVKLSANIVVTKIDFFGNYLIYVT